MSRFFELMQEKERVRGGTGPVLASSGPSDRAADGSEVVADLPLIATSRPLATAPRPRPQARKSLPVFSLRSFVEAGFRHSRLLFVIVTVTMLVTVLVILFLPRRYQATMQLVVLSPRQFMSSNPDEAARASSAITQSDVNFQAELLRSRDVLNQALEQMGPLASPELAREQSINALGRMLEVAPVPGSNILKVSFTDSSPQKAKNMLQGVASSFVSRELALLRPTHQQVFAELVAQSQRELAAAQKELASFQATSGIASAGEGEVGVQRQLEDSSAANLPAVGPASGPAMGKTSALPGDQQLADSRRSRRPEQAAELERLQKRVAMAQRILDLAAQKRDLAVIDDAFDKDRVLNFAFAVKPWASLMPVQPRPLLYLASGLLIAILLAAGYCACVELARNTVCTPAELEMLTGYPTLATVPMLQPEGRKRSRTRRSGMAKEAN